MLEIVDESLSERRLATLAAHLGGTDEDEPDAARRARRFSIVRHLTDLFDLLFAAPARDGPCVGARS